MHEDDIPTTEEFLALCYNCKLTSDDLEQMNYGSLIDYIDAFIDMRNPEPKVREATQQDIENFFG